MKTYKFDQFNIEIINPIISINLETIQDKAISKLLSVGFYLITESTTFVNTATDMPYIETWEDSKIEGMVSEWLKQFEV